MLNLFPIKESYKIRHVILRALFDSAQKEKDGQRPMNRISLLEISNQTKISFEKLKFFHESLHEDKEIDCVYDCDEPNDHFMIITTKGRQSYIYEKYLKDGLKESKDSIKDIVSIFSPAITWIIAIISLFISFCNYQQNKNNKIIESKLKIESQSIPLQKEILKKKNDTILMSTKKEGLIK